MSAIRAKPLFDSWRVAATAVAAVTAVFGGFLFLERAFFSPTDLRALDILHIVRGLASTFIVSGIVAWQLTRNADMPLPHSEGSESILEAERVAMRASWLIRLRWLAVAGVFAAILCAHFLGILSPDVLMPLLLGAIALAVFNGWLAWIHATSGLSMSTLTLQLGMDTALLLYLLHFAGAAENPFCLLFLFQAQVGAILLPSRAATKLALGSAGLLLLLGAGEYSGMLTHHPLLLFPHYPGGICFSLDMRYLGPFTAAFLLVYSGTTFFTVTVMNRLRSDNEQVLASERLSALGRVVGFVAHEVNNPIAIISARAHLALSRPKIFEDAERTRKSMEVIAGQADRVGSIVRSLLAVTWPSSKASDAIRIADVLEEAGRRLEERFRARGIKLDREYEVNAVLKDCRFSEVVQIISSLLLNALEASSPGARVLLSAVEEPGWVRVLVKDEGCGIRPEDLPRIFEPFFTTKLSRGSGLGLALCSAMVKTQGGSIDVHSEPGQGSEFIIRMPAAAAPDATLPDNDEEKS